MAWINKHLYMDAMGVYNGITLLSIIDKELGKELLEKKLAKDEQLNNKQLDMKLEILDLKSVGCGFCTCCGSIHPKTDYGKYDMDNSVHISEVTQEWKNALSLHDYSKILQYYPKLKNV